MVPLIFLMAGIWAGILPFPPADHVDRTRPDPNTPADGLYTLHRARPAVEAELVWPRLDPAGYPLTGRGILICDVDGLPDIHHPMFFKADRGRFSWIDVDGNGRWSPGDAVDIDGDGLAGPGETLGWMPYEGDALPGLDRSRFQAGYDFLFQDVNGNGLRDFGAPVFSESDPCYGEGIFLADDANGNGDLDAGESLIGLKTSKIRAVFHRRVYRRGVDLIDLPKSIFALDTHGSLVMNVLAGGWPGRHALTGIAPDAELICATGGDSEALEWAREEGADVVLWEYAGRFSDGSSATELKVNELARDGILFIAAAGNDRAPKRHVLLSGSAPRMLENRDSTGVAVRFAWPGPSPVSIGIRPPADTASVVTIQGTYVRGATVQGLISLKDRTPRGTVFLDMNLRADDNPGAWMFWFPGYDGAIHGYALSGFGEPGAEWVDGDGAYTVTSPGAADSAITVAAYENDGTGDIAWFSGEGPRLDGRPVVDIAAPGVRVLSAVPKGARFAHFTGTSAAIPFVAGAAALLKQAFPALNSARLRALLTAGAARDSLTTDPNRWGAGRLRIHAALLEGLMNPAAVGASLTVRAAPNPARGAVEILGASAGESDAEIRIFSIRGALVWESRVRPELGSFRVTWSGRDAEGGEVPAGVYFAHVKQGRSVGVGRITWVK